MTRPLTLVIEDHKEIAEVFAAILEIEGYEVEMVKNGETAVKRLTETTPALVILDMYLPDTTGEDILRQIRQDTRLAKTRVVIVTAFPQTTRFLSVKADTVLCKPLRLEQIRHIAARFYPTEPTTTPESAALPAS